MGWKKFLAYLSRLWVVHDNACRLEASWSFAWTGGECMKDLYLLLDLIHTSYCRPEFMPNPDGTTHCNQFVSEVAAGLGFKGFEGLLANDIVDLMTSHDQWSETALNKAQELANLGTLVVAGIKEVGHGHVNIVVPGREKTSGRWGQVPSVANVGKENFIGRGLNWAFSNPPKLWAYRPTL